jgi:hypothetical protein
MGAMALASSARSFLRTFSSLSPNSCRRSEWPMMP